MEQYGKKESKKTTEKNKSKHERKAADIVWNCVTASGNISAENYLY